MAFISRVKAKILILFLLPLTFTGSFAHSELNLFLGGGNSMPRGEMGAFTPSGNLMYRSGLNYELGQFSFFRAHIGGSLSRFEIEWEGQKYLNQWTYYQAGLHVGLSRSLMASPKWGNRMGVTVNSKWIPYFVMHDDEKRITVSGANKNGLTDIDIYIQQNLGGFYIRPFFVYAINQLIPQGNLKVNSIGFDILIPIYKSVK